MQTIVVQPPTSLCSAKQIKETLAAAGFPQDLSIIGRVIRFEHHGTWLETIVEGLQQGGGDLKLHVVSDVTNTIFEGLPVLLYNSHLAYWEYWAKNTEEPRATKVQLL